MGPGVLEMPGYAKTLLAECALGRHHQLRGSGSFSMAGSIPAGFSASQGGQGPNPAVGRAQNLRIPNWPLAQFSSLVTIKGMTKRHRKRGRPRSAQPKTPAERMRAYRARKASLGLRSVSQWVTAAPGDADTFSNHRLLDARSLALHCLIARRVSAEPALLEVARDNLRRWQAQRPGALPRYLGEWEKILAQPWPDIAGFISSFSARAVRLRQSSPFAGVLRTEERNRVYAAFRT
jgi:hypothetical protein